MADSSNLSPDLIDNLRLELRRGSLVLAVLLELRTERYGYDLRKAMEEGGIAVDEGTLYPLLRRLETQGLLRSEWRVEEKRPRRFYSLSAEGGPVLDRLIAEWQMLHQALTPLLRRTSEEGP